VTMRAERDEVIRRRKPAKRPRTPQTVGGRFAIGLVLLALLVWGGFSAYRHADLLSDPGRLLQAIRINGKPLFGEEEKPEAASFSTPVVAPRNEAPEVHENKQMETIQTRQVQLK